MPYRGRGGRGTERGNINYRGERGGHHSYAHGHDPQFGYIGHIEDHQHPPQPHHYHPNPQSSLPPHQYPQQPSSVTVAVIQSPPAPYSQPHLTSVPPAPYSQPPASTPHRPDCDCASHYAPPGPESRYAPGPHHHGRGHFPSNFPSGHEDISQPPPYYHSNHHDYHQDDFGQYKHQNDIGHQRRQDDISHHEDFDDYRGQGVNGHNQNYDPHRRQDDTGHRQGYGDYRGQGATGHNQGYDPHRRQADTGHRQGYGDYRGQGATGHNQGYDPHRRQDDTGHRQGYGGYRGQGATGHNQNYDPHRRQDDTGHRQGYGDYRGQGATGHNQGYDPHRRQDDTGHRQGYGDYRGRGATGQNQSYDPHRRQDDTHRRQDDIGYNRSNEDIGFHGNNRSSKDIVFHGYNRNNEVFGFNQRQSLNPNYRSSSRDIDTPPKDPPPPYEQIGLLSGHSGGLLPLPKKQEGKADNSQTRFRASRLGQKGRGGYHEFGSNSSIQSESSAHVQRKNSASIESEKRRESIGDQHTATPRGPSDSLSRERMYHMKKNKTVNDNSQSRGGTQKTAIQQAPSKFDANQKSRDPGEDAKVRHDYNKKFSESELQGNEFSDASSQGSEASAVSEMSARKRGHGRYSRGGRGYRGRRTFKQKDKEKCRSLTNLDNHDDMTEISSSGLASGSVTPRRDSVPGTVTEEDKQSRKRRQRTKKKKMVVEPGQNLPRFQAENKEPVLSNRLTRASLQIPYTFTDTADLKEIVTKHMEECEGIFHFQFVDGSVSCSDKQGECTVEIQAASKQLTKHLIKMLCKKVNKSLKTKVIFTISGDNKDKFKYSSNAAFRPHTSSRQKAELILAAEGNFTEDSDEETRKETKENKTSKIRSARTEEATETTSVNRHDITTDKMAETNLPKGDDTEKTHRIPAKIPTEIFVVADKVFTDKQNITELLSQIIKSKDLNCEMLPDSVLSGNSKSVCKILAPSKLGAKEVLRQLKSYGLEGEGFHFFCQPVNATSDPKIDYDSKVKHMQAEIEKTVDEITRKTKQVLEVHKIKLEKYEDAIEVMQSAADSEEDDDDRTEKFALLDKLAEVCKQRDGFITRRDALIEKVKKLSPLSTTIIKDLQDLLQNVGVECKRLRAGLPIYARREEIVKTVSENQVSVILGETGSGKSTQMAQYIYEAGLAGQGMIVCTQPRKVAAITLAERVAEEMVGKTGNLVGYKTGMQKRLTPGTTKIIFATDHSLLNDCLSDQTLSRYTCIIVDEAHERSIYTDLLLGMIKACLPKRPDLKVIITSATIDPEIFIKYFKCKPELRVSGRTFPVEVIYSGVDKSQEEFDNFESRAVQKAIEVHKNEEPGDILVFLTSPVEIMRCCEEFQKCVATKDFQCFPLHGQLPPDEQRKVFERLPQGIRKVVFATNCAETSITIDGIKYVIDAGVAKEKRYDSKRNICSLGTFVISRSSADQRKGRAGRTSSGKCFRLYSEEGYRSMSSSNEPEILKVPLAQSVLKLSELGVDIKQYDFVQPPSEDAIDLAVKNLTELGALSPEGITDIGLWISKLPLEPKEGFLIFKGKENNLLYDSIVVAALVTNGSNLFYRGLTESEAQKSAKTKSQYSSPHGDIFTWLEVYKDCIQKPKKEQSKWCTENGINYKVINYTRQFVEEVITVLNNELKTKLERKFSTEESAVHTLQKILFYANLPTVCHYLGHVRAGYHALMADRQVHLHPSSSFLSQNSHPEWIIYTEFTKTSRDFIKGITVVSEDWIQEAVSSGKLQVDINVAKQWKTELVHRETVGLSVFHKMVGTRYARLREWEDELTDAGMKAVVVEADRDLGILDIYSCSAMNETIINHIASERNETVEALKSDEVEIEILKKIEKEPTGIRVTLGQGGCVKSLLMPYQSNKILIKKSNYNTTEEVVRRKFGEFGNIKECVRFKQQDPWGFIRYDSYAEAQSAVDSTSHDEENVAVLKLDRQFKKAVNEFQAKLSWCRRPVLGAIIKCPPIEKADLIGKSIYFSHGVSEIKMSKKGDDLVIFNIGNAGEVEIQRKVMDILNYNDNSEQNIHVTLMRKRVELPSQKEMNYMKDTILNKFSDYVDKEKFRLQMIQVKMNSANYIGFIYFDNPVDGFRACRKLQHQLRVGDQIVEINPKLKTTLHVSKSIMKVCKTRLEEIIAGLSKYKNTEAKVRPLRQGDSAIDINSECVEHIVEARELIRKELEGEVIDCSVNAILKNLLKQQTKDVLRKLEVEFEVLITVDSRREQVHIYGSVSSVNKVQSEINNYLGKLATGKQVDISLKGQNKPPGLMKELMLKYGSSCDGLIQEFALSDVTVDFRQQKLSIIGPPDNVDNAVSSISELENSLLQKSVQCTEKWMPECVVCMSPVEGSSELYRLEACGHSYCLTCLKLQIGVFMTDKNFPVVCAQDGCGEPLVWKDLSFCLRKRWITEKELVEKSAGSFVSTNLDKYRFCLTPECPVIYKVTENEKGCEFTCPSCFISLCSSCHTPYHAGLTCKMSSSESEAEKQLEEWRLQDPGKRKICPHCKVPVEKTEGCNKMFCTSCHTYFCWLCLEICEDEQRCYAHLAKKHGGFFD